MKKPWRAALALLLVLALAVPAWAANEWEMPEEEYAFYRQLSPAGQETYDILNTAENLAKFRSGEEIRIPFSGTYGTREERDEKLQAGMHAVLEAADAIIMVHPEIFWIQNVNVSQNGTDYGGSYEGTMALSFRFYDEWSSGARSVYADEAAVTEAASAIAEEACVQGGPYEQLLYVHDWLTEHNIYNESAAAGAAADHLPWTPLSALTDVSQPVCEGYARAFSIICSWLGYPCLFVSGWANGGNHAWNQVNVGGNWYAVDVTFDDPRISGIGSVVSGYENHKYFLVGEETFVDGEYIFSDNHFPGGSPLGAMSFTYPALAPEGLDPGFTWGPPDAPDDPDDPEQLRFADVDDTAYYAPAVQWAVVAGVTNGTGSDPYGNPLFSPGATVNRCQAVTFLWRAMGQPEPETKENPFKDVAESQFYYKAVLWAVENGVTNGMSADTFAPDDPVKCGQMLTFLWRAVGRPGETEPYEGKQWYSDAESWAAEFGITGDAAYANAAPCPRGDVVYYLYHAMLSVAG